MALVVSQTVENRVEYGIRFDLGGKNVIRLETDQFYMDWTIAGCLFADISTFGAIIMAQDELATNGFSLDQLLANFRIVAAACPGSRLHVLNTAKKFTTVLDAEHVSPWREFDLAVLLTDPDVLFRELAVAS